MSSKNHFLFWGEKNNWSKDGVRKIEYLENIKIFLSHTVPQNNLKPVGDWMNKCIIKILKGTEKL